MKLLRLEKNKQKENLARKITQELSKFEKIANSKMQFLDGPSILLEINKLKEKLQTKSTDSEDPVLAFLQHQEIRNFLRTQDPTRLEVLVREQNADFSKK